MCPLKQLRAPTMAVVAVILMGWLWRAGKLFQVIIVLQWCSHFSVMRHGYKSTIYLNKNWQQFRQQRAIWMSILVLVHLSWAIYVFLISFLVWQWHQKNHYQSRGVLKNGLFTALTVSKCENLYPFFHWHLIHWYSKDLLYHCEGPQKCTFHVLYASIIPLPYHFMAEQQQVEEEWWFL